MGKSPEKLPGILKREKHLARGRMTGVKNKVTRVADELNAERLTIGGHIPIDPKEYFLDVLADENQTEERRDFAAKELMPYYHSKAATTVSVKDDRPKMTDAEIRAKLADLLRRNGLIPEVKIEEAEVIEVKALPPAGN